MAQTYSTEMEGPLNTSPATKASGSVAGGRVRRYLATVTFASQASADTIVLAKVPRGMVFSHMHTLVTVSTSTATISVGDATTAALYKSAGALANANIPYLWGRPEAQAAGALTEDTEIIATIGTASLPASGTMYIELFFSHT